MVDRDRDRDDDGDTRQPTFSVGGFGAEGCPRMCANRKPHTAQGAEQNEQCTAVVQSQKQSVSCCRFRFPSSAASTISTAARALVVANVVKVAAGVGFDAWQCVLWSEACERHSSFAMKRACSKIMMSSVTSGGTNETNGESGSLA